MGIQKAHKKKKLKERNPVEIYKRSEWLQRCLETSLTVSLTRKPPQNSTPPANNKNKPSADRG